MKCDRKDCERDAAFRVGMDVWVTGYEDKKARGTFALVVCSEHADAQALAADLLHEEGKESVKKKFRSQGFAAPDNFCIRLDPIDLSEGNRR